MKTKELGDKIIRYNESYRKGEQEITDQQYDKLVEELSKLDPENNLLKKAVLDIQIKEGRKQTLPYQMASMNKAKSLEEVLIWVKLKQIPYDTEVVITPKLNGISMLADYKPKSAWTRGNGVEGQQSDQHFAVTNSKVDDNFKETCVGEMIISTENWNTHFKGKISPSGLPYKLNNATVSGLFNNDKPTPELKYVDFVKYGVLTGQFSEANKIEQLAYLNKYSQGATIKFFYTKIQHLGIEDLNELYKMWSESYPIDGLIIEVNDNELRNKLGRETNGNPAYARALKLDKWSQGIPTVITGYDFQISKQGKLKGIVTFDPVLIDGTEVKQATFYNAKYLKDMCLIPGVEITIKKSGDIIPKISSVNGVNIPLRQEHRLLQHYEKAFEECKQMIQETVNDTDEISNYYTNFIDEILICPSCGEPLKWDENFVELICGNKNCEQMLISKLEHFFTTLGVEEFGRPSIQTLFNAGLRDLEAILSVSKEVLSNIQGFGEASADIVLEQFKKLRLVGVPLARLMHALDLFEGKIGEKTVQLIFDNYSIIELNDMSDEEIISKLPKIKGISEATAVVFLRGLYLFEEFQQVTIYVKITNIKAQPQEPAGDKCVGMSVCFSGVRDSELESVIKQQGGKIASGVSKNSTHLIIADKDQTTSKTVKARELGQPVMLIEEFKNLIGV